VESPSRYHVTDAIAGKAKLQPQPTIDNQVQEKHIGIPKEPKKIIWVDEC
jgi:hypothetical protein